jgi:hypothetical protein
MAWSFWDSQFAVFDIIVDQLKICKVTLWRQNPPHIVFDIILTDQNLIKMLFSVVRQNAV